MSGVDVLAYHDALIEQHRALSADAYHAQELPKAIEARATVADLVDIKDCANSLITGLTHGQVNHHHVAELCRLLGRGADTSAALARITGEGA